MACTNVQTEIRLPAHLPLPVCGSQSSIHHWVAHKACRSALPQYLCTLLLPSWYSWVALVPMRRPLRNLPCPHCFVPVWPVTIQDLFQGSYKYRQSTQLRLDWYGTQAAVGLQSLVFFSLRLPIGQYGPVSQLSRSEESCTGPFNWGEAHCAGEKVKRKIGPFQWKSLWIKPNSKTTKGRGPPRQPGTPRPGSQVHGPKRKTTTTNKRLHKQILVRLNVLDLQWTVL